YLYVNTQHLNQTIMKKELIFYYIGVVVFFVALIFSVRHIVNTTRIFVSYEDGFNPIHVKWNMDDKDSTLRVKDPLYLKKDYYLIDYKDQSFIKNDTVLYADLLSDSLNNKGCVLNIKPPYYIWKEQNNDTLKVFKHSITLKFTKKKEVY
ncbi:hypothetical protein, partial [Algoriella sp.]|uniref:hypothetical protein n=1 Tax=Algoriella sp. TaxID=1872434 RepID=UPI001B01B484